MNRNSRPTGLGPSVALAVALVACAQQAPEEGGLTRAAVAARRQGRATALVVPVHENTGQEADLRTILNTYSLVLATATTERAVQVQRDTILTWQVLRDAEWLSRPIQERPSTAVPRCAEQPPRFLRKLSADGLAIPLEFGDARIYGVDVKVESTDSSAALVPGQQYLLIADQCQNENWRLPFGLVGVVYITTDRRMQPLMTTPRPFLAELRRLGTIEELRTYLAHARLPS